MAENLQNTSSVETRVLSQAGLITDLNSSYVGENKYTHARNAVRNSKDGDLGTIGNEPSNSLCFSAPYKIIGTVTLPDDKVLVFSTDNTSSEIGEADLKNCSYKKLLNSDCLKFNENYPISGVAKKDFQKGIIVTFTDKNNPVRRIEINNISKIDSCDDLLLFKKITQPCITVRKGFIGNIPNGSYSVLLAYTVDGVVFSDYYSISDRIQLNSEISSAIEVDISGLDDEFSEYTLVLVGSYEDPVTKGTTKSAKKIGTFSSKITKVNISDFINPTYEEVSLNQLVIKKASWQKAGIISSNANYLMLSDLVARDEENYQLKAMSIQMEYVVEQVPADYYINDGLSVGYYRDENYDFAIQGIYNTGEHTDAFHIPGPRAEASDLQSVTGDDVYELDSNIPNCNTQRSVPRWQAENTAGVLKKQNNEFFCGRRVLGTGKMGYFQSTERYPDNIEMFGKDANQPIRFPKMPDECKVPRYETIDGVTYINIIGVRFKNIPAFDNPDIVGYRILRSDRKGGNGTVIARGLMSNIRYWEDTISNRTIMYSNYNVNHLGADPFLSETQTVFRNNSEHNYKGLSTYYKDRFSFYSPHTLFDPKYALGNEIKIESEEIATVTGKFEKVYNHPQAKLLNQFAFWLAAAVGFIESVLIVAGRKSQRGVQQFDASVTGGLRFDFETDFKIESVDDLVALNIPAYISAQIKAQAFDSLVGTVITIVTTIASLGIKVPYSIFSGIAKAEEIYQIISDFTGYTDYVYQYVCEAKFTQSICVQKGNKRRALMRPAVYVPSEAITIDDKYYNNSNREQTVYLQFNKEIDDPTTKDTSTNTVSGFRLCGKLNQQTTSVGSLFYATSKVANPNQYGRLGSAGKVSMHSCTLTGTETPVLYGGDCIITKMTMLKKMPFFTQDLANTNFPPGVEYDYRLYNNIGYTRYWMDTSKYDFSSLLSKTIINNAQFTRTTTSKHNLDCKVKRDGGSISRIDNAYMYTSSNCAVEYFVECDYNIAFRKESTIPFYSRKNTNLSEIFRSDKLKLKEEFLLSSAYGDIYPTEVFALQQRLDFSEATRIPALQPNSVIYSLPSFNLQQIDNWQYFLPANYFAFRESDFGDLTGIHKLDQDRLIFLFSKSSPYISMGRDFLELEQSGRKITIGDGGLFAQDPREVLPTDNNYGASTSPYAFSNTHLGRFYPSSVQGRIFSFTEGIDDITRGKMSYWCKNYMPINLYNYFPTYQEKENPISGVGYLMVFDSFQESVYIIKRDFSPKREYINDIIWSEEDKTFKYKGQPIALRSRYFNDVSWTLSYSGTEREFISWHDWHPDWVIQTDNHFLTVKDNGVWKHNESYDSYCNFYGVDYPFEVEFLSTSGQQVHTIRSIEYLLEVYKYKNNGRDRFHVMNENFDSLFVHNTEQMSPVLHLIKSKNNPEEDLSYPRRNSLQIGYDILFTKEENKYRINQFWDSVKDRGEFSLAENHLLATDESGYKRVINPVAIDINKPEEERKKFRHYFTKFSLSKTVSGTNKFIVKLANIKKLISVR